ncbi:MAG: acyl-CoA thioesterase [Ignavibacteriae bacterium]|nr:MAG: acyl-CoA thioesterase [Ignavibacteriota bacterium]
MPENKPKFVKDSQVIMIELVLPNDTNMLNNLLGGRLMHWMDIACAMAAAKHCNNIAVTASVDNLAFHTPIRLGNIVTLKASVNRAFGTSMEVGVKVEAEDFETGEIKHSNSAHFTFVSVDKKTGKKMKVPEIIPQTEEEKRRYENALERRNRRMAMKDSIITDTEKKVTK